MVGRSSLRHFLHTGRAALGLIMIGVVCCAITAPVSGQRVSLAAASSLQDEALADRPIAEIRIEGLNRVSEQLVRNNIRSAVGDPFSAQTARDDQRLLERLGEFRYVDVLAELTPTGGVILIFSVEESIIINEVQTTGNRLVSDQELLEQIRIVRGLPRDDFAIQTARRRIADYYRDRGYYLSTVEIDEAQLTENGVLIFRIIEGPRVRVKKIAFASADPQQPALSFQGKKLAAEIKTRTSIPLLRKGELVQEVLDNDVADLVRFYQDRGYLDVRVDRTINISPDNREAIVTFLIVEGRQFILRDVRTAVLGTDDPLTVFTTEQVAAMMALRPGDVFSRRRLDDSIDIIQNAYGIMGYIVEDATFENPYHEVTVRTYQQRVGPDSPFIDLLIEIDEGQRTRVGLVRVIGNFLTREKVILREVRMQPGRPLDTTRMERSEQRIQQTRLFNKVDTILQDREPADSESRDVLIEIKERNTGSFNFGVAVGSDSGVLGEFALTQNNFDIEDYPESLSEWFSGRAFRGAGQTFSMVLRPGNELFQYSVSLTEPHVFDTDYSFTIGGNYRERRFDEYDEERISLNLGLGRRLGDIWSVGFTGRFERVQLQDIEPQAPVEIFRDEGPDTITGLGIRFTRSTIDRLTRPTKGTRLELSFERIGALGGDFDFNKADLEYTVFIKLDEDFLGRVTTLRLNTRASHIFGGGRSPTYERYRLGGRSFRGFDFRTIAPKGIRNDNGEPSDESVGGEWLFFAGAQYEFPIFADSFTGVFFADTGTVVDSIGFDDYRVAIGAGIRLYVPQLGPVPIAFDLAVPIVSEETDEEQVFSFSAEIPF